jgi:hypothetical protein
MEEQPQPLDREFFRHCGRIGAAKGAAAGGRARAAKLSPERRSEIARQAQAARKPKPLPVQAGGES